MLAVRDLHAQAPPAHPRLHLAARAAFGASFAPSPIHIDGLRFSGVDSVMLLSKGDPAALRAILANPRFPRGVEVLTGEMSLTGWHDQAGEALATGLQAIKKQIVRAHRDGDAAGAARRQAEYTRTAERARESLLAFARRHASTGGIPADILALSREKHLTLWVGAPRYDAKRDKLYNSYFCVKDGRIAARHDKKFLYSVERDVFDAPEEFEREKQDEVTLICWETEALNPHFHKPSPLEGRKRRISSQPLEKPFLVHVAAYWPNKGGVGLRGNVSQAVRRGAGADKAKALRPEGSLALVSNDGAEAYVMGPPESRGDKAHKAKVYAEIGEPGILRVRSDENGDLILERYDRWLNKVA